jgi:hypothetical protein
MVLLTLADFPSKYSLPTISSVLQIGERQVVLSPWFGKRIALAQG